MEGCNSYSSVEVGLSSVEVGLSIVEVRLSIVEVRLPFPLNKQLNLAKVISDYLK